MSAGPTATRFEACLAETLRWEGAWSNERYDPGGATMQGIIQRVYDGWRAGRGEPRRSVREIEATELRAIYRSNYWDMVRGDELPVGVDLALFDFAVNAGPSRSVRTVQRLLGVRTDSHLGPVTLAAIGRADPDELARDLMAARRSFLRALPHFWKFGKGWLARCDGIERACRDAICVLPPSMDSQPPTPAPLTNADEQSAVQARALAPVPPSMAASKEGQAALAVGGGGLIQVAAELGRIAQGVATAGKPWSAVDLVIALSASPTFWAALSAIVGGAYLWLRRRQRLLVEGV